jgi:tetratricopeptide (TPR) repeat protein
MQILERTKGEIDAKVRTMSDFLKMEYLEKCLTMFRDPEILKYCYTELARLYEGRIMYSDALKYLNKLHALTVLSIDKFHIHEKEIELLIKAGNYERVPEVFKMAIKLVGEVEAMNLKRKIIKLYQMEAQKFDNSGKNLAALKVYERLIPLLTDHERNEARKKLLNIYKKLGRVRESIELEKMIYR